MTDNELIAEFMGHSTYAFADSKTYFEDPVKREMFGDPMLERLSIKLDLKYHDSWDWLMPVIHVCNEKCKETGYPDGLELPQWHLIAVASNIKLVYFSVVEFIKWYNQNK